VVENSVLEQLPENTCVAEHRFRTVLGTVLQNNWLTRTQWPLKNIDYFRTTQETILRSV